ncbi:receptor-type tyrosine-protein phosphatase T-like [Saccostrea echinata]|uniref:receptor-type tyrosine-protein phosphatase T-like n=1 Tax=Saccostrea echinata TaxID=191078 RepID=UPI002A7EA890|nr:receptor-type tyrosine-protein phosphatase T-like [Saccostrea echinata]
MMNLRILQFLLSATCTSAYVNLALGKPAWQKNNHQGKEIEWGAEKAVDGHFSDRSAGGNQCTISANGKQTATWRVDLQRVVSVSYINIYYRTDNAPSPGTYYGRFAGFSLYVSNTTLKDDGYLCFHEIQTVDGTPTENQTISCPVHGRYVIYYNERRPDVTYPSYYSQYAYIELCELEVYGCSNPQLYEEDCNETCPENCQDGRCNITTGDCLGCIPGYKGPNCSQACEEQMYGLECMYPCGNCSDGESCHHVNGTCPRGCIEGVEGTTCQNACQSGYYGKNCSQECSINCGVTSRCNRFTGKCDEGCKQGWREDLCDKKCDNGTYGMNCTKLCGDCRNDTQCHHVNGWCLEGCSEGYKGSRCDRKCDDGMYGQRDNCTQICGSCLYDSQCDDINGTCSDGCSVGYKEPLCIECDDGMYGENCTQTCGHCYNKTQCHPVNGSCFEGCSAGYTGSRCDKVCTEMSPESRSCSKSSETASSIPVIAGVITAVVFFLIIFAAILVRRSRDSKRNNEKKKIRSAESASRAEKTTFTNIFYNMDEDEEFSKKSGSRHTHRKDNQSYELYKETNEREDEIDNDENMHKENPYGDLSMNEEKIPDIDIENLEKVIKEKRKNEDDGFKREYATMPYGEKYPCNAGKQPENILKNRYKNTLPYDHSRIKLLNSQSDYINANFIDGISNSNEYIATQGPRKNTVTDFWSMIWQENAHQIVTLTNLKEGKQSKCVRYWPDLHQTSTFGVISLSLDEEESYANYKIRKFSVTNKGTSRIVTQYHYTAWPDHGIPEPLCLVLFHDHVTRTIDQQNSGPILVHCSAGIGPTGTYIAIDALYKAGKTNKKINIAEYVKKMRENRMNMVQTYEQYMTIFLALDTMFKAPTCVLSKAEFLRKAELMTRDKQSNKSQLTKEFQTLVRVRPSYTEEDYKLAVESGDNKSVLPLDKYSMFLSPSVTKRGNYINAVSIPSYLNVGAFIITHYPPPEDAVDFLRLLTDHESNVVICMDPVRDVESTSKWMPSANNSKSVPPFTIICEHEQVSEMKCTTFTIYQNGENSQRHSMSIIEPKGSLKNKDHSQVAAEMLRLVVFALQSKTDVPITVVSSDGAVLCGVFCAVYNTLQQLSMDINIFIISDGAVLCGVFCAVYNTLQQLSMDGEVDIFSAVRQLQIRRPELCPTMEEYILIHDAVYEYIRSQEDSTEENTYTNL